MPPLQQPLSRRRTKQVCGVVVADASLRMYGAARVARLCIAPVGACLRVTTVATAHRRRVCGCVALTADRRVPVAPRLARPRRKRQGVHAVRALRGVLALLAARRVQTWRLGARRCLRFSDLDGFGESSLLVGTVSKRLKVYRGVVRRCCAWRRDRRATPRAAPSVRAGTALVSDLTLQDVPVAICSFYTGMLVCVRCLMPVVQRCGAVRCSVMTGRFLVCGHRLEHAAHSCGRGCHRIVRVCVSKPAAVLQVHAAARGHLLCGEGGVDGRAGRHRGPRQSLRLAVASTVRWPAGMAAPLHPLCMRAVPRALQCRVMGVPPCDCALC